MKSGDKVILESSYRAYGISGGWKWKEYEATIVLMFKRTAVVSYINDYGHPMQKRVHISRIRPMQETLKVNMKFSNLELEVSGE